MLEVVKNIIDDESGATAIEYGLIAALVTVAAIGSLNELGDSIISMFVKVQTTIDGALKP